MFGGMKEREAKLKGSIVGIISCELKGDKHPHDSHENHVKVNTL